MSELYEAFLQRVRNIALLHKFLRAEGEPVRDENTAKALEDGLAAIVVIELPGTLAEKQLNRNSPR